MKAILKLILFSCLALSSCQATKIAASKDQRAIDLERKIQGDYTLMYNAKDQDLSYSARQIDYAAIESEISALLFLEQSRPRTANLVGQVKKLQNLLLEFEAEHKAKGTINKAEATIYKLYLDGPMANILTSENSYK